MPVSARSETPVPNPQIPQALLELLGQVRPSTDRKAFHQHLVSYFMNAPHSSRKADELPWQMMMCGNHEQLCTIVGDPRLGTIQKTLLLELEAFRFSPAKSG